jgi:hypothetical protein
VQLKSVGVDLDVVTLSDPDAAIAAVRSGTIEVSFRAVTLPARQLPGGVAITQTRQPASCARPPKVSASDAAGAAQVIE